MTHTEIERGDLVERYLLRRLTAREEAEFEEHYLECPECRERLAQERPLLVELQQAGTAWLEAPRPERRTAWFRPAPVWGLAAAFGAAAVYVSVILPVRPPRPAVVQTAELRLPVVELSVFRAGGGEAARAKAGEPFMVRLDARGLAEGSDYALEIASESGDPVWNQTPVSVAADRAQVQVTQPLAPGRYWVRLARQGRLVREYELRAGD
jgi:hypothetical protein